LVCRAVRSRKCRGILLIEHQFFIVAEVRFCKKMVPAMRGTKVVPPSAALHGT
jgi:hypothetical protein